MLPVNYKVALEELKESGYIRNDYIPHKSKDVKYGQ